MKLTNMKLSKAEKNDQVLTQPSDSKAPQYPWGLTLSLDNDSLKKLGVDFETDDVGEVYTLVAKCKVIRVESGKDEGSKEARASATLQITEMAIEEDGAKDMASKMYGG